MNTDTRLIMTFLRKAVSITVAVLFIFNQATVFALPQDYTIISGDATVTTDAATKTTTINATSANTIINWNSFNIANGESVIFNLPDASSASLNRVTGPGASNIAGIMNCNGLLILVNPSGIYIAPTASINVGSIILSTRDIANSDFLMKNYAFKKITQDELGAIIKNEGTITVSNGGFGVMIAGAIENKGHVTAPIGRIALAAGDAVKIDIADGGRISVAIEEKVAQKILDKDGKPITDAIKNTGTLDASGGLVTIDEGALPDIFEKAINLEGTIKADTATITADGKVTIGNGGTIETDQSTIDAPEFEVVGVGDQHFYGDMTIYNFTCQAPGKTIYFDAGHTYDIPGELKIQGTSTNRIQLLSSEPGKQWYIRPSSDPSKVNIEYIKVQDSNNLANYLMPMRHSLKISNNTNWDTPWYFLNTSGDYTWELLTNWWENQDGTGSHPISLPGAGDDVSYVTGESGRVIITVGTDVNINNCYLDLENNGVILGGTFYGSVINNNSIANTGGCNITFNGAVTNNGSIGNTSSPFLYYLNLVFNGTVDNYGTIGAGSGSIVTFNADVINREGSLIRGGDGFTVDFTFNGTVDNSGTIESINYTPIDFNDQVINRATGVLVSEYAGYLVFNDEFINEDTGAFSNCTFNYLRFYYGGTDYNWETQENWFTDDAHTTISTNLPGTSAALDYATGGSGTVVINSGTDVNVTSCALDLDNSGEIAGGSFSGTVTNSYSGQGVISGGAFTGSVVNNFSITDGTFADIGSVNNNGEGTISDGEFNGDITNSGYILGGTFSGSVTNNADGNISGGTFTGDVTSSGTISGGTFADPGTLTFITNNTQVTNATVSGITVTADGVTVVIRPSVTRVGTTFVEESGGIFTFDGITYTWTGTLDGDLANASNYDIGSGVPGADDTLDIPDTIAGSWPSFGESLAGIVNNYGEIHGGSYTGEVTNYGLIDGGMGCDFSATVTNHGTIASGTFGAVGGDGNISYSDGAYLWFGGSVSGNSLTINSGTFSGESIFFGDSGVFSGSVTNNASGTIANGTYSGSVTNYGTICPGTTPAFTGSFDWQGGTIGGSGNTADFSGLTGNLTIGSGLNWDFGTASVGTSGSTVTNNGTISAGTFNGTTTNNWEINGGSYYGAVVNDNVINAGDFHGSVANNGTITNGTFYVTSRTEAGGTINGGYFIYDWLGSASGDVTDESNWEMSVVPGEGVTAWIGGSPNYWPDSGTCDASIVNAGTILGGLFNGSVDNNNLISGGSFYVTSRAAAGGTITGGTFLYDWTGADDGDMTNSNNWYGAIPGTDDTGYIPDGLSQYPTSGDCDANIDNYGIIDIMYGAIYGQVNNYGTIKSGTFGGAIGGNGNINYSDGANLYFGGAVTGNSLTINSGTFDGLNVFFGDTGAFYGDVEVTNSGTITSGSYYGLVTNRGTITSQNTTISGSVVNYGTINIGTNTLDGCFFGASLDWEGGTITNTDPNSINLTSLVIGSGIEWDGSIMCGKAVDCSVTNNGTISSGTFTGPVTSSGTVSGGTFSYPSSSGVALTFVTNNADLTNATISDVTVKADGVTVAVKSSVTRSGTTFETDHGGIFTFDGITYTWTGTLDGDLANASNYDIGSGVPGADDTLDIPDTIAGSWPSFGESLAGIVNNYGEIHGGSYTGEVAGDGDISYSDGVSLYFGSTVTGNSLTINSGTFDGTSVFVGDSGIFSGSVTNGSAISGGSFTGTSRSEAGGTITGGTFLYDWTGADDGDMTNSNNWYGAIPGTDDTGYIPDGLSQYPTSGDCNANIDNYGIIDIMYGTIYGQVNNYGTIKSGTFGGAIGGNGNINYSHGANIYFGGAVTGNSLTINSGTFFGESIFVGDSGVFSGSVTNNASGTIANGTYSGSVTNYGTICPGTTPAFTGSFDWQSGTIGGSGNTVDFSGLTGNLTIGAGLNWNFDGSVGTSGSTVTNNGTISSGIFNGTTTNNGEINTSSGYFFGSVINNGVISSADCDGGVTNYSTISNGTFESPVYIMDGSRILGGGFNGNPEIQNFTTINSGTFNVPITNSGTIQGGIYNAGTVSGDITVTSGNTLGGTAEFLGHVYLSDNSNTSAGGTYDFTPEIQSGTTINNGNFATPVVNNGIISGGVFSGDVTNYGTIGGGTSYFTGSFDLESGSIGATADFSGLTGTLTIGSGQTWDYNGSVGGSTINNGIITAGTFSAMLNNGTIDLNGGSVSSIGSLTGNGIITDNSGGGTSTLTITQGSDGTYGGVIQDGASALVAIVKDGSGTLTLTGANSYSGGTTISGGTLSVGDGGTTGSITGDITNNSSLIFNRSNAYTYADVISGSGSLTKDGSGTLTLTGANTYSGTATVNDGTLSVANSDALGTGSVVINTGGTLALDTITSLNIAGDWTNAGGTFDYTGTTVNLTGVNQDISGDNTFNDLTKTSAGTLTFEEDKTLTVSGMLTITGVSGDLITLNSSGADRWNINITSDSYDLQYLDVNDSNNLGTTIIAPNSTITNSIGWLNAPPPPTPSATSTTGGWVPQTQDYICDPWLDWVMYQNYSKYWAVDEGYLYLDSNFINLKGILLAKADTDTDTATA